MSTASPRPDKTIKSASRKLYRLSKSHLFPPWGLNAHPQLKVKFAGWHTEALHSVIKHTHLEHFGYLEHILVLPTWILKNNNTNTPISIFNKSFLSFKLTSKWDYAKIKCARVHLLSESCWAWHEGQKLFKKLRLSLAILGTGLKKYMYQETCNAMVTSNTLSIVLSRMWSLERVSESLCIPSPLGCLSP